MPESLETTDLNTKSDPSTSQQYDTTTSPAQKFQDLYKIIDKTNICMLTTTRQLQTQSQSIPVSRAMGVSKRHGPDLLFLANAHSRKFDDLAHDKNVHVTFHDSSSQEWASIAGVVTLISNDDPRIKELYSPLVAAWFGDAGDGVHDGTASDPRMTLIEVQARYVVYWKREVGMVGFVKEVVQAAVQGDVAMTGVTREMGEGEIEVERKSTPGMEGGNDSSVTKAL